MINTDHSERVTGMPITNHTADSLRAFEQHAAETFNAGKIRAPVHLAGGNEEELLEIFERVERDDWVFAQWRSHYHCLLKGVSEDALMDAILAGRSITLAFPEYRILTSAIVGGIAPIALGVAHQLKQEGCKNRAWLFIGDMTACGGVLQDVCNYAESFDLPLTVICEDNGMSVCTPTEAAWGPWGGDGIDTEPTHFSMSLYTYNLPWPHSGAGKRVEF